MECGARGEKVLLRFSFAKNGNLEITAQCAGRLEKVGIMGSKQRFAKEEVCCSVLQCVAVCCSVLQCVAVCCSVLSCDEVCHRVFRWRCGLAVTVCQRGGMLQCVAVCCSAMQRA